ncbi:hypothetical protein L0Y46_02560 [bacterium]|nr:hypothetical protein [bacterium]
MEKHIVKRRGGEEHYDERKVYGSCYAACLNSKTCKRREAEEVCAGIADDVTAWVDEKEHVASDEIFGRVANALETRDKNAGLMYRTHRDLS